MVSEYVPNALWGVIFAVILTIGGLFLSYGIHTFYESLKIYHRLPSEYEPVVAYSGTPPGCSSENQDDIKKHVRRYITSDDIKQKNDYDIQKESELPDNNNPRVEIDFTEGETDEVKIKTYGEDPVDKLASLAMYSGFAALIPVAIVVGYFIVLTDFFDLEGVGSVGVIGALMLVYGLNLGIRIGTLAKHTSPEKEWHQTKYRNDLHEFAYSFYMSLYLIWSFTVVIGIFINGLTVVDPNIPLEVIGVVGILVIVLPFINAFLSHIILRLTGVPDKLASDKTNTYTTTLSAVKESKTQ